MVRGSWACGESKVDHRRGRYSERGLRPRAEHTEEAASSEGSRQLQFPVSGAEPQRPSCLSDVEHAKRTGNGYFKGWAKGSESEALALEGTVESLAHFFLLYVLSSLVCLT